MRRRHPRSAHEISQIRLSASGKVLQCSRRSSFLAPEEPAETECRPPMPFSSSAYVHPDLSVRSNSNRPSMRHVHAYMARLPSPGGPCTHPCADASAMPRNHRLAFHVTSERVLRSELSSTLSVQPVLSCLRCAIHSWLRVDPFTPCRATHARLKRALPSLPFRVGWLDGVARPRLELRSLL